MPAAAIVKLENDVIPTKDTKLLLAGIVSIPPVGKHSISINMYTMTC